MRQKLFSAFAIVVCVAYISYTVSGKDCKYQAKKVPAGRKCRKPCRGAEDCKKSSKKKCLCDDVCGMSCFNPNAQCPEVPSEIINGRVDYQNTTYGSVALYSCMDGYKMKGRRERKCQSDRKWSGKPPKCLGESCPFPPRIDSSFANTDESHFDVGDIVTYKCRPGFSLSGTPNITCQPDNTWSSAKFICIKQSCGDPGKPLNGWVEADDFLFGNWAMYKCDKGYELQNPSRSRRYCSTNGRWSGSPSTCIIKSCRPPTAPMNGEAVASSLEYGSVVKYSCDRGYLLVGNKEGACNDELEWGETPTCDVDINCKFEVATRPLCGYTNEGTAFWKRQFVDEDKDGLPSNAVSYDAEGTAVLRSPAIPSAKPHCIKFYYYIDKQLEDNDNFMITLNTERVSTIAKKDIKVPTNRWVGFQVSLLPKKEEIIYEIVVKGSVPVLLDELQVTKGKCKSQCEIYNPCGNGGVCVDEVEKIYCSCTDFFKGELCEKEISCAMPVLKYGKVKGPDRLIFGSVISFECDQGYELRGTSFASCTADGLSKKTPVCAGAVEYQGDCPLKFSDFGLMCYRVVDEPKTYDEAEQACIAQGGRLAVVQSEAVSAYLKELQPDWFGPSYFWVGLRSLDFNQKWISGDEFVTTKKIDYDLRNAGKDTCGAFHFHKKFLETVWRILFVSCKLRRRFMCEAWKKSANSYSVKIVSGKSDMKQLDGVYKPVSGLVTPDKDQIFRKDVEGIYTYLYYNAHPETADWGTKHWYIGKYSIMQATPGPWKVRTRTNILNLNGQSSWWKSANNHYHQILISAHDMWGEWTDWVCDVTCGPGNRYRRRLCKDEDPQTLDCKGSDTETGACNLPPCEQVSEVEFKGMLYTFEKESVTWDEAKKKCEKKRMQLADSVHEDTQNMLIRNFKNPPYWINGIKDLPEWEFLNGTIIPEEQRLWARREPNGYRHSRDCVELNYGGWNDHACGSPRNFICQKTVPTKLPNVEPTSLHEVNPCSPDPCRGRGSCRKLGSGKHICFCRAPFTGNTCEDTLVMPTSSSMTTSRTSKDPCTPDPCNGGGKCSISTTNEDGFVCFCRTGNFGSYCEKRDACPVDKVYGDVNLYKNEVLLRSTDVVSKGEEVLVKCKSDFEAALGEVTISCLGGGEWSRVAKINCVSKRLVCSLESVSEVFDVYSQSDDKVTSFPVNIRSGTYLRFACKAGGNSGTVLHCTDGQWQSSIPSQCVSGPTCPDVASPDNGSMVISPAYASTPYQVGVSISFSCKPFYKLTGAPTIRCMASGSWSSAPSQCREVGCLLFTIDLNEKVYVKDHNEDEDEIHAEPGDKHLLRCRNSKKKTQIQCMGKDRWEPSYEDFLCE